MGKKKAKIILKADDDLWGNVQSYKVKNEPRTIGTRIHTKPKEMIKASSDNPRKTRLDNI